MFNKIIVTLMLACVLLGCSAQASKESKRITEIVSRNVVVGASRESVIHFCASQGWNPKITHVKNYGDLYSMTFFDESEKGHSVIVEVWINGENKVKSFRVFDAYTAL